jgi:hypothetical protein
MSWVQMPILPIKAKITWLNKPFANLALMAQLLAKLPDNQNYAPPPAVVNYQKCGFC